MTLVVACLTPEFVSLVADRRVTDGKRVLDDLSTKVVVICDRSAVAFSGLARIPTARRGVEDWPRTDEWIVRVLAEHQVTTISSAAKVLANEATAAFLHFRGRPSDGRLAFALAGWSVTKEHERTPTL